MKNCVICDVEFEPYRPHALYCGQTCRKEGHKRYFRNRTLTKEQRDAKNKQAAEYRKLQSTKDRIKKWKEENKEHLTKYFKRRYALKRNDAEWVSERNQKVRERRKDPSSRYNSIMNKITHRIRRNLGMSLKYQGIAKVNQTFKILGFDKHTLREHLESQFTEGMSWDNMGEWHIDHIRPIASFNYDSTEHPDFKKCWALNNLQPLWAADNIRKGDKWNGVVNA